MSSRPYKMFIFKNNICKYYANFKTPKNAWKVGHSLVICDFAVFKDNIRIAFDEKGKEVFE